MAESEPLWYTAISHFYSCDIANIKDKYKIKDSQIVETSYWEF